MCMNQAYLTDCRPQKVTPDYRNQGVNAILMNHVLKGCHKLGITVAETGPQLETNEQIQNQWSMFKYRNHKKRRCWVKQLCNT